MSVKDQGYYQANRAGMAAFLPSSYARVLEVGCGEGTFATHLARPCETWGIEPATDAAEKAAARMDHVLSSRYDTAAGDLPDGYFDLAVCNDVIEHMSDHDWFLESVKSKLRPGGYLVGSIPNIRHITALFKILVLKDWKYSDSGILDSTHLRFFTERSLRRSFAEHGFQIERLEGIGSVIRRGVASAGGQSSLVASTFHRIVSLAVVVLSAGYYWDTQYPQFAFRVRAPGGD